MKNCKICGVSYNSSYKELCPRCYHREYFRKTDGNVQKKWIKKHKEKWNTVCKKNMRKMRAKKYFNLTTEEYEKLISKGCIICGFETIVELHHIDKNKQNNDKKNLIPLCPNHHRMIHMGLIKDTDLATTHGLS